MQTNQTNNQRSTNRNDLNPFQQSQIPQNDNTEKNKYQLPSHLPIQQRDSDDLRNNIPIKIQKPSSQEDEEVKQISSFESEEEEENEDEDILENHDSFEIINSLTYLDINDKNDLVACCNNIQLMIYECSYCTGIIGLTDDQLKNFNSLLRIGDILFFQFHSLSMLLKTPVGQQRIQTQIPLSEETTRSYVIGQDQDSVNIFCLVLIVNIINPYLRKVIEISRKISLTKQSDNPQDSLEDLIIVESKLQTLAEWLPYAAEQSKDDIFSIIERDSSPDWKLINEHTSHIQLASTEKIIKATKDLSKIIYLGNAVAAQFDTKSTNTIPSEIIKKQRKSSVSYLFSKPVIAERKASVFLAQLNMESFQLAQTSLENTNLYKMIKKARPSIKYYKKIQFSRDGISILKMRMEKESSEKSTLSSMINQNTPRNTATNTDQISINFDIFKSTTDEYYSNLFVKQPNKLKIIVLCNQILFRPFTTSTSKFHKQIIVHIHGGALISMSEKTHQLNTRKWANDLKIPVFSIQYNKFPGAQYPELLDDCFQAYQWIIKHAHNAFNIQIQKIILVGDSIGGNLAVGLTQLCIKYGILPPTGIVVAYPSLSLTLNSFTPSKLSSLEDTILTHTLLKLFSKIYIPQKTRNFDPSLDPFLSPVLADDQLLRLFPPIRISVGTNDPFFDDCIRFHLKLLKNKRDSKLTVYEDLSHGYLSLDVPDGFKYSRQCIKNFTHSIEELLAKETKNPEIKIISSASSKEDKYIF